MRGKEEGNWEQAPANAKKNDIETPLETAKNSSIAWNIPSGVLKPKKNNQTKRNAGSSHQLPMVEPFGDAQLVTEVGWVLSDAGPGQVEGPVERKAQTDSG